MLLFLIMSTSRAAGGQLEISVVERETGKPIACRMHLHSSRGTSRRPKGAPFWHDHFVFRDKILLKLPVGNYTFEIERGLEYPTREGHFRIDNFADDTKKVDLGRFVDMTDGGWYSGDLNVRRPLKDIELLMDADDLHVAQVVTWFNDKDLMGNLPRPKEPLVTFDRDRSYHVMAGGHSQAGTELLYFNAPSPLLRVRPEQAGAAAWEYPPLVKHAIEARQHDGLWIDATRSYWWDLPMLVAAGQVDSIQIAHEGFCRGTLTGSEGDGKPRDKSLYPPPRGNARWSQDVYFKLLDCGLRIPPSAGSGSGVAPNPVGYNRMYVQLDGTFSYAKWFEGLRAGRVVVTNGPLLQPTVWGHLPGHVFQFAEDEKPEFELGLTLSTREPISYLEVVRDGRVAQSIRFEDYAKSGRLPKMAFERSGWFLLRAVTDTPKAYRFAMTGPYYVEIGPQRRISRSAAQFFLDWVYERARQLKLADPARQAEVIAHHRQARDFWQGLVETANAE